MATIRAAMFRSYMEKKSTPIEVMLDEVKKQQIEENRKQLRPIIRAIFLCGRQNIALRGNRDDAKYYLSDDVNPGNFIEILKYGVTCYCVWSLTSPKPPRTRLSTFVDN